LLPSPIAAPGFALRVAQHIPSLRISSTFTRKSKGDPPVTVRAANQGEAVGQDSAPREGLELVADEGGQRCSEAALERFVE
jgi:hypothetical protein